MTGRDSADPEGSWSRGWMVFTQGPRCGGAGSLRGPRRCRTLTVASEGRPEKEDLETEAQRAIGSGPCRDSGRRVLAGERESGLGGAGGPPGRTSVHPAGHTPSASLALPSLANMLRSHSLCGGPTPALPPHPGWKGLAVAGVSNWPPPLETGGVSTKGPSLCVTDPPPPLPLQWEGQEKTGG